VTALESQLATVSGELAASQRSDAGIQETASKLAGLEDRLAAATSELAAVQTAAQRERQEHAALAARLEQALAEKTEARRALAEGSAELATLRAGFARLQNEQGGAAQAASEELESLRRELAAAQAAATAFGTDNRMLEDTAAERGRNLAEAQNALVSAQHRINELNDELAALAATASPAPAAADSTDLAAAVAATETARQQAADHARTIERLSAERATLSNTLEQSLAQVGDLTRQLAATQAAVLEAKARESVTKTPAFPDLRDQARALETQLANVRTELDASQRKAAEASIRLAALNSERDTLARQLTATEQALSTAQAAPKTVAVSSLKPELDAAKASLATALARQQQLEQEKAQLRADAGETGRLAAENSALAERLAASEQVARELEDERSTLRQQLAAASVSPAPAATASVDADRLAELESKLSTTLRSFSLLQDERDRLQQETAQLAARQSALEAELAGSRSAADTQVSSLSARLNAAANTAAQAEILRNQLRQTQDQLGALTTENAQLRTRLAITAAAPGTVLGAPTRPGTTAAVAATAPPPAPAVAPVTPETRTHVVAAGDTLSQIARQYYGDSRRWPELLEANRPALTDERSLRPGMRLSIP
jgi:chromosome segregation ATPase